MNQNSMLRQNRLDAAVLGIVAAIGVAGLARESNAAPLGVSVVVERIGGDSDFNGYAQGNAPAILSAVPVFMDEFTLGTSTRAQSLALPTTTVGAQRALTEYYRNDTHNGYMTRSVDGQYLVTSGYQAAVGTASVGTDAGVSARRPIGLINMSGNVDTSSSFQLSSRTQTRSIATVDGNGFYINNASTAQGLRFLPGSGTIATQTPAASSGRLHDNAHRAIRIFDNKVFFTSNSSTAGPGLSVLDPTNPNLPTSTDATGTALPIQTFANTGTGSFVGQFVLLDRNANGFAGTDLDTAYIGFETTNGSGTGGVQKWAYNGTSWSLQYTLADAGAILGLDYAGDDALGNAVLYATTTSAPDASAGGAIRNRLVKWTDNGATATSTLVATSPANAYFRGVAVVPEPTSIAAIAFSGLALLHRRRRS
jgi:hypothetical protein